MRTLIYAGVKHPICISHPGGTFIHSLGRHLSVVLNESFFSHEVNVQKRLGITFFIGHIIKFFGIVVVLLHKIARVIIIPEFYQSSRMVASRSFLDVIKTALLVLLCAYAFFTEQAHKIVGFWIRLIFE